MVKLVCLLRKADDLSTEEFRQWWLEDHSAIVRRFPGLRRYAISFVTEPFVPPGTPQVESPCDGFAELWFEDRESLDAAYAQAVSQEGRDDTYQHVASVVRLVTVEHEIELSA